MELEGYTSSQWFFKNPGFIYGFQAGVFGTFWRDSAKVKGLSSGATPVRAVRVTSKSTRQALPLRFQGTSSLGRIE
jgi:hypothetical protein